MTPDPVDYSDRDLTLDAAEDRWAWRAKIRAKPSVLRLYRIAVFGVGLAIVVLGLALVPLPGPGWLIVFLGVAIWASEFERAQQLLDWGKETLSRWNSWVLRSPWWVKVGVTLGAAGAVGLVFWGLFALFAVPAWFPDPVEGWLTLLPGVR